jgi:hypothetical protein
VSETEIRHDLFVYESDAAAAAQIERFAVAGLEADESVIVVVSAAKQRLLRRGCGYDARVLPETVVQGARRAHRVVHAGGVWQINRDHEEPEAVVRSLAPAFEVLPGLRTLPLGDGPLRDRLGEAAEAEGVPAARVRDLLVAAGEVFSNAEQYGCGVRSLRAGRVGASFVCEVTDAGSGLDDALAGYLPPPPLAPVGARLWIARQLTSRLELLSAHDGLTVRLWI